MLLQWNITFSKCIDSTGLSYRKDGFQTWSPVGFFSPASVLLCSLRKHLLSLVSCSADFRSWRWRRYVPPKRRFIYGLYGSIFITTAVRTSNPTTNKLFVEQTSLILLLFQKLRNRIFRENTDRLRSFHCWKAAIPTEVTNHLTHENRNITQFCLKANGLPARGAWPSPCVHIKSTPQPCATPLQYTAYGTGDLQLSTECA
jgi:hypothetical protein